MCGGAGNLDPDAAAVAAQGGADHQADHAGDGQHGKPEGNDLRDIRMCEGGRNHFILYNSEVFEKDALGLAALPKKFSTRLSSMRRAWQ